MRLTTCLFVGFGLADPLQQLVQVAFDLEDPALVHALLDGLGADLRDDAHAARQDGGLRLGAAHASQTRRYEHLPGHVIADTKVLPSSVQQSYLTTKHPLKSSEVMCHYYTERVTSPQQYSDNSPLDIQLLSKLYG